MPAEALNRAEQSFRATVLDEYGLTEASAIVVNRPGGDRRAESCGKPFPGTVRVVDAAGNDVPPGTSGEIVVRGPTLFPGYLDDAELNAAAFLPGGWFRTGDLGSLDDDGFLYLTGRLTEMIDRAGEKIAPAEIDRLLLAHPTVRDAAAFGVPDSRLGEDIVAAVAPQPGVRIMPRELRRWLLDHLSGYKVPRRIWLVAEIPRTETGKPRRAELTRRWQRERQ
jgi:acyl-CoA synthetase (AMP-forming)/AMP-acid ligase II